MKSKLECQGYQNPLTIVDQRRKAERAVAKSRSQPHLLDEPPRRVQSQAVMPRVLHYVTPSISTEMPLTAFKRNVYISFLIQKMSDGRFHKYKDGDWWVLAAQDSCTASIALDALTTKFFGRAHGQEELIVEGTWLYTKALQSLRTDLMGPQAYSLGTLAATSTLSMYELIAFSTHFGWIQHAGGLGRLLQVRGPQRHKTGNDKNVFLENRILLISQAMLARKRTFLGDREWKEVPWEEAPETKEPFDFLLDIATDIAGLQEDIDQLTGRLRHSKDLDDKNRFRCLTRRLARAFDELDAWWRAWATNHLHSYSEAPPDPNIKVSYDDQGPVFDSVLHFESYWICYVTILHNALRIVLLWLYGRLSQTTFCRTIPMPGLNNEPSPLPLLGISTDSKGLGLEVFRCVEFCEQQSRKFLGTFCILFPIFFAQYCIEPQSRVGKWMTGLSDQKLESFKTFQADAKMFKGLMSCGTGMFGLKVTSNTEMIGSAETWNPGVGAL